MRWLLPAAGGVVALAAASLFVGVSDVTMGSLFSPGGSDEAVQILLASRLPRTLALVLAGTAMAVSGLILQMLARNKFVEPSTAGTAESAVFGMLMVTLLAPGTPIIGRMLVASLCALAGTTLFLAILRRMPLRSPLVVPLVGLMLGAVITASTEFVAYRYDLMQSVRAWETGDFSGVLRGRYELLWISGVLTAVAYAAADRFTVAGLGEDFTTNLGLDYRRVVALGLVIVSLVTAAVIATCGMIPFLGLVVPNLVSLMHGDNMRRSLPWVALTGAGLVLACDIAGRLVIHPYEIPIGTTMGVVGSGLFLYLLLRRNAGGTGRAA
ncbi:ABC transporter permease [Azospirillum picis]|uniref:Iron complex transport system permease protein n=1 Tax=Azospirillum picis TaxID=488438 RepID=A0ABU0MME1_9PROT|nr:ABC transporter permease [Azospirillum picis]MBP2301049.1 iron complex transport system permease protein [Azospirillum picis]MDQ0534331.1 iron complex transport system permease protein [Azospirillum picis]